MATFLKPLGAFLAQFLLGAALIFLAILLGENIAPPAVHALVHECLWSIIPPDSTQRHGFCGMRLHIIEGAHLQHLVPLVFLNGHIKILGNAPHFAGHISLEISKVHKEHIGQVSDLPPRACILPKRPPGIPIEPKPVQKVFLEVVSLRRQDLPPHPTRSVVHVGIIDVVGVFVMIPKAHGHVASITSNVNIFGLGRKDESVDG
mmetsp:Transcript_21572/g.27695  ORF Transcript_21572/g.27695 Transcript_21572/m.27695 type:complete len:204 (+) Transcript_21572:164-775(+)